MIIKSILYRLKVLWHRSSSERYVRYLRSIGMKIGQNVSILSPNRSMIDEGRASYITIGNNVILTSGVSLIAHDYSWSILRKSHDVIAPTGGGKITIGDNVFIGVNSLILRNVTIGNNVIIGAGSVVNSPIPENCVAAGNPARVIMSLDEYCDKRKNNILKEAVNEAKHIAEVKGRDAQLKEMLRFSCLFLSPPYNKETYNLLKTIPTLGDNIESYLDTLSRQHSSLFNSFEEFIDYVHKKS